MAGRAGLTGLLAAGVFVCALAAPAWADVERGAEAWARGDYAAAVSEWQGPAAKGDPDAQFNLAQAYRLGQGIRPDPAKAEDLYARAAAGGHLPAADNYGLLLFQQGRKAEALPYVQAAADRGDPRAQYLLGIAHFNADIVPRNWPRAYALLTLANGAGLPQAVSALAQMDRYIPLEQRQMGISLAGSIREQADAVRTRQLAAVDLGVRPVPAAIVPPAPVPAVPQIIESAEVLPSVASAQAAVAEAARVTGGESPALAGADFAGPAIVAKAPASKAKPLVVAVRTEEAKAAPSAATAGPWKLQLGAFSVDGSAEKLWTKIASRPELMGRSRLLVPAGRLTKLLAGGFVSQAEAKAACAKLTAAGQACLVTR